MDKYKLTKEEINLLFFLIDNYLKNKGLSGIYNCLDVLKQLSAKTDYDDYSEIEINEFIMKNINDIFDVNLKIMGMNIFDDLSKLKSSLVKKLEKNE